MTMGSERRLETIHREIGELAQFVEKAMKTVSELGRPIVESSAELPTVASHLTDLVRMTEKGVLEVMRLTELIQDNRVAMTKECRTIANLLREGDHVALAGKIEKIAADLDQDERKLTEIMTALSFQDLAAQRVKTLVAILEDVREKLVKLTAVLGVQREQSGEATTGKAKELLQGLQRSRDGAMQQRTADEILAQYGFE
ncbi:MAG: protein phosphatase CheZ [Nitrospira sp.]|nr:protein phosphatase CheZ [Nitrospira sp.]